MYKISIIFLLLFSFSYGFKVEQEFNIKTTQVVSKNVSTYKEFYGKVQADKSKIYDVNLRFDGFVTKLYADSDFIYVNKGDKLFDIYSKEIYNLYDELSIAKRSSKRLYNSIKNKFTLFNINPKNKINNSTTIKSGFSGYITKHNINNGSFIKKGQKVLEITDLNKVWIILNIYQKDIEFVKKHMKVSIKVDGIKKTFNSKVDYIYPNINKKDQTVNVRVIVENKDLKLFPNMFAKAKIYEKEESLIVVPKNSVIQRDGKQYVFFKDGKEYSPSEVKAVKIPQGYKIIQGLEQGDTIVTNALFLLDSDAVTNGLYSDDW